MAFPFTDPFTGTGALSGTDYTAFGPAGVPERTDNELSCATDSNAYVRYTGQAITADQSAKIKCGTGTIGSGGATPEIGVLLRAANATEATLTGYLLNREPTALVLYRVDAGPVFTQLATRAVSVTTGDTFALSVTGSTFTILKNDIVQGATVADATYSTGTPGFYTSDNGSGLADDFIVDQVGGGGGVPQTLIPVVIPTVDTDVDNVTLSIGIFGSEAVTDAPSAVLLAATQILTPVAIPSADTDVEPVNASFVITGEDIFTDAPNAVLIPSAQMMVPIAVPSADTDVPTTTFGVTLTPIAIPDIQTDVAVVNIALGARIAEVTTDASFAALLGGIPIIGGVGSLASRAGSRIRR